MKMFKLSEVSIPVRYNLNTVRVVPQEDKSSFNSSKVQFEHACEYKYKAAYIRFNSSKVQFELAC